MRTNVHAIRVRVERLAATVAGSARRIDIAAIIQGGRQRRARERAARIARGEPEPAEPVLTHEEQRQRARAFRDRMRALGVLPPLRNVEDQRCRV
jgi:hypothetical protein